ncbi:mandelate racemase/muconate lactonizing enzyme family protein [Sneathiella sp.]|uniref:mandelate racemase/muconate lactonizing enzyme family protein n=1 Tax=Sneathiella sp. TaxID=1964365 RepID=UPI00356B1374
MGNRNLASPSHTVIEQLGAYWLRLPLLTPYENSLGTLSDFDVILISVTDNSGRIGWGEACPVKGYSPEDPTEAWNYAEMLSPELKGLTPSGIALHLKAWFQRCPFLVSAITEAVEDLENEPLLRMSKPGELELAGTVNTLDASSAAEYASGLIEQGYRTLKVKVGYDPKDDAHRVNAIVEAVGDCARLRVDANQGYQVDAALAFARSVPEDAIEFFEQPVDSHDWQAMATIASESPIPIMLDEAIYGDDDIRRSSAIPGIAAVKLKLSKAGGAKNLYRQFRLAQELGLQVTVGNGVASDLGCLHEALVCLHMEMPLAGEMNGFIKTDVRLLEQSISVSGPKLVLPASSKTRLTQKFDNWIHREMTCA